jgi:hypothetical protein
MLSAYDIQFVEKPKNPKRATVGPVDDAKIQEVLRGGAVKTKPAKASSKPQEVVSDVSSQAKAALNYVDKLECARKYASEENQRILDLKIETAKELYAEVFGERD